LRLFSEKFKQISLEDKNIFFSSIPKSCDYGFKIIIEREKMKRVLKKDILSRVKEL